MMAMAMEGDILENIWQKIAGGSEQSKFRLSEILDYYSEPHRHYHTIHHVKDMLQLWLSHQQQLKQPALVALAVIFHDVIYDPKRNDNEEKSAEFFLKHVGDIGLSPGESEQVAEWIMLTKSHQTTANMTGEYGQEDSHYLLDFDMAVLGWPCEEYDKYSHQIRQEYIHVPSDQYNSKRAELLRAFLGIPYIYATKYFRDKYENQARKNIQQEITRLEKEVCD